MSDSSKRAAYRYVAMLINDAIGRDRVSPPRMNEPMHSELCRIADAMAAAGAIADQQNGEVR